MLKALHGGVYVGEVEIEPAPHLRDLPVFVQVYPPPQRLLRMPGCPLKRFGDVGDPGELPSEDRQKHGVFG
jgi:hypothetical protein